MPCTFITCSITSRTAPFPPSTCETYFEIPENKESHFDVIYRNVKLNTDFECVLDVAVQYKEEIKEGEEEISFVPIVVEVGDLHRKKGWKEIDCTGKKFISENKFP